MAQFLTDFGSNILGSGVPTGWSVNTGTATCRLSATTLAPLKAEFSYGSGTDSNVVLNSVGTNANQEILVLYKMIPSSSNTSLIMSLGRAQSGALSGYGATAIDNGLGTRTFQLQTFYAGIGIGIGSVAGKTWTYGEYWWARLVCNSTSISVKYWKFGTAEPTSFDATATNSTWTTGLSATRVSSLNNTILYFSVGTGGDVAPWLATRFSNIPMMAI